MIVWLTLCLCIHRQWCVFMGCGDRNVWCKKNWLDPMWNLTRLHWLDWTIRTQWALAVSYSVNSLLHRRWVICIWGNVGKRDVHIFLFRSLLCVRSLSALSQQRLIQAGVEKTPTLFQLLKISSCCKETVVLINTYSLCVVLCMWLETVHATDKHPGCCTVKDK